MSATTVQLAAIDARKPQTSGAGWPACEQNHVDGDGSMRWLGALALAGSSLLTFGALGWIGQVLLGRL